jgi:hypothetical protein
MKLSQYLEWKRISCAAFAQRLGVTRQAVHRYRAGQVPIWSVMEQIYDETDGAVTPNDFLSDRQRAAA